MPSLKERVLARTFVEGKTTMASKRTANNIFDMRRINAIETPGLFKEICIGLGKLALAFQPDGVTYVPDGAYPFARAVARELDITLINLIKDPYSPFNRGYKYGNGNNRSLMFLVERLVIVEDVGNSLESVEGVLRIPGIGGFNREKQRAVGAVGILRRGLPEEERPLPIRTSWLIEEPMPHYMDEKQLVYYRSIAAQIGQV